MRNKSKNNSGKNRSSKMGASGQVGIFIIHKWNPGPGQEIHQDNERIFEYDAIEYGKEMWKLMYWLKKETDFEEPKASKTAKKVTILLTQKRRLIGFSASRCWTRRGSVVRINSKCSRS
jgi:hypothetical protein